MTLRQVAQRSGVSVQSASHILGGRGQRYHAETRERVHQAARELNYQPNLVGRALVRGKTMSVGVIVKGLAGRVETDRLWTLLETAREHGYHPYLVTSGRYDHKQGGLSEAVRDLMARRVDGLIVARSMPISDEDRKLIRSLSVPVVFMNWAPPRHRARIAFEPEPAIQALAEHLRDLGHRRAAVFVSVGSADFLEHRIRPFQRAFTRCGLEAVIVHEQPREQDPGAQLYLNLEKEHRGYEAVRRFLASGDAATALCMTSDEAAQGGFAALREAGLDVPGDMSVVGFGDLAGACYTQPPLTSVRTPRADVGGAAFEMLYQLMREPEKPVAPVRFPFELVVRQSTGPAPHRSPHVTA